MTTNPPRKPLPRLRDGGGLTQGPMSSSFWRELAGGFNESVVQPIAQDVRQFDESYPVVNQVAQVANPAYNVAVGVPEFASAVKEGDWGGAGLAGLGMVPLVGKYAKAGAKAYAGTKNTIRQVKATGMPSKDMVKTGAQRVVGDVGLTVQAGQLGNASYNQTTRALRGPQPGPFYGGQPPGVQ